MYKKITTLIIVGLAIPQLGFANLQNFVRLHEYFKKTLSLQEGSFVGRGVNSDDEYQLTLLSYSPNVPDSFVVILERLDKASAAYFSTPTSPTQSDLFKFVLSQDKATLLPPFEGQPQMTLALHQVENDRMMLELKPSREDSIFGEVVRFHWGRTPQVYRDLRNTRFQKDKSEVLVKSDNEGSWAEVSFPKDPTNSGLYRISDEGIPGLFVLRRVVKDRYGQEESEEISHVVYFSRRVVRGLLGLGKSGTKYVTTISSLSNTTWELERD